MASLNAWRQVHLNRQGMNNRFAAAELAWFVGGASNDGLHLQVAPDGLHPLFTEVHGNSYDAETRVALLDLLFDVATVLDRAYGGSTMVIQLHGTMRPNAPILPAYMKTSVYMPPVIVRDVPLWEHSHLIHITQEFLEVIGTRAVTRFQDALRHRAWRYRQPSETVARVNPRQNTLPTPVGGSACYVIHGHPVAETSSSVDNNVSPPPDHSITTLQAENTELRTRLTAAIDEITLLKLWIQDLECQVQGHATNTRSFAHTLTRPVSMPHTTLSSHQRPSALPHTTLSSLQHPSAVPRTTLSSHQRPSTVLDDDQLPMYSAAPLSFEDVVERNGLDSSVDTIVQIAEFFPDENWKCALDAIGIDQNAILELVNTMQGMRVSD
ncbi:hypothetical protein F5887DRAFT_1247557 [Amanita rubescens]|nr:hypothetical protein F5887DRAFT_1247557 [Amanita rubescens]